jgi:aminopeptidase N
MMVNDHPLKSRAESIDLTIHEIFHTIFPFYMGINETKYGWMDEGWATMSSWLITPMVDSSLTNDWSIDFYQINAGMEVDLPIITLTTQQFQTAFFINSYPKPALGYLYIKDLLGDELFYKGLHQYIRDWNGKHPMPYDFFNSMNVGSGVNLNWFWSRWFFERGVPDLAIGKFTDGKKEKSIVVEMKGDKPLPIDLSILFTDGTIQNIHRSTGVWELGNKSVEIRFASSKKVKEITLGSPIVPDVNKKDNHLVLGT